MHKVAVIEDNLNIQNIYKFKLELGGYLVKVANHGLEALSLIEDFKPELILLDLKMPIMGGAELLSKLYEVYEELPFKVFILTNISFDEVPTSIKFLKYDKYLVKAHLTPSQLLQMVDDVFK